MDFPENVSQRPPTVPSTRAKSRKFGLYSLFSGCLPWAIFVFLFCFFVLLLYSVNTTVLGGGRTLLWIASALDLLAFLGTIGAIVFGHLGILKGPTWRTAAITGLVLGYLALIPILLVGLVCLFLLTANFHMTGIHGL